MRRWIKKEIKQIRQWIKRLESGAVTPVRVRAGGSDSEDLHLKTRKRWCLTLLNVLHLTIFFIWIYRCACIYIYIGEWSIENIRPTDYCCCNFSCIFIFFFFIIFSILPSIYHRSIFLQFELLPWNIHRLTQLNSYI